MPRSLAVGLATCLVGSLLAGSAQAQDPVADRFGSDEANAENLRDCTGVASPATVSTGAG